MSKKGRFIDISWESVDWLDTFATLLNLSSLTGPYLERDRPGPDGEGRSGSCCSSAPSREGLALALIIR
jgi:hypothetical protein